MDPSESSLKPSALGAAAHIAPSSPLARVPVACSVGGDLLAVESQALAASMAASAGTSAQVPTAARFRAGEPFIVAIGLRSLPEATGRACPRPVLG
jgi:hypothetical protein